MQYNDSRATPVALVFPNHLRNTALLLLVVSIFCASQTAHAKVGPYVELNTFFYSQPVPVKALSNKWRAPLQSGDRAFTHDRFESGVAWNDWKFGWLYRYDYQFQFTPETAELVHSNKNKHPLTTGRVYPLYLSINGFRARGFRLGKQSVINPQLTIGTSFSLLEGIEFMEGRIWGNATALAEKDYDVMFNLENIYSKDTLFDRRVLTPKGTGYSLDLNAQWQVTKQWHVDFQALDILGEMEWPNAPYTSAIGNTNNKTFDDDGYVRYKPTISGVELNRDYTQPIPRKIFINTQYNLSQHTALLFEHKNFKLKNFTAYGGSYSRNNKHFSLLFDFTIQAATLRYRQGNFALEYITDAIEINDARVLSINTSYIIQF